MKKFPFSKKAMNIMIATALLVTPLASLAPVGGANVVSAETIDPASITSTVTTLTGILAELSDADKATIKAQQAKLNSLDWTTILDKELIAAVDGKLNKPGRTVEIAKEIAAILLETDTTTLLQNLSAIYSDADLNGDFSTVFGADVTIASILDFSAALETSLKANYNKTTFASELATFDGNLTKFMKNEIQDFVGAAGNEDYKALQEAIKIGTNDVLTFDYLYGIQESIYGELFIEAEEKAALGNLRAAALTVIGNKLPEAPPSPGGGGGGTPPVAPVAPGAVDASNSTTTTTQTATDGSKTVVSTVDVAKLTQSLQNAQSVDKVTLTIQNPAGQAAELKLPAKAFDVVSAKNPNAKVEIQSTEGTIRVPVKEINVNKIAQSLGVNADDVTINVSIRTVSLAVKAQGATQSKSPVVEFKITATSGDKSIGLNRFNSHIEREISAPEDLNADRATVVRLNEDGSIDKAVPTVTNGKKATFKSMSNSFYTVIENEATFPDIKTNWAKTTIEKLASKMVINGMPSGNFEPTKTTTRAEFAALLTRSLGLNNDAAYDNRFKDVNGGEWFVADMMAAVEVGILEGHADGSFKGNDAITREQAAAMIVRAMELTNVTVELDNTKGLNDFADKANVSTWAASSVEKLIQAEIITGRPNAQIAPKGDSQRAEVSAMLERFLKSVNFMN